MEILIARTAGFCFGVKRALEMVATALKDRGTPIYSLGPLIHNPQVVADLAKEGLRVVEDLKEVPVGRVVIRSHGVGPKIYHSAVAKELEVIDATCPFVKNVQQLAVFLYNEGYQVIICGEREHAEVKGVLDAVAGSALVINSVVDLKPAQLNPKVGLISQTTQEISNFQQLAVAILPYVKELRVFNTVCLATSQRQQEVADLSSQVDLMIVVGGKNSANTTRLVKISRNNGTLTYQVETAAEILAEWFAKVQKVGITAGASTPELQISEVIQKISSLGGIPMDDEKAVPEETEQMSYDWPDDRFKELEEGQIIDAKVILVRDDAVFVDIGGKSDLTIPLEELSLQPGTSAKSLVKTGDLIKVMVTRVAGDEDKIRLSKRLVEQEQVWFDLESDFSQGKEISGTVTDAVNAGLNVNIGGVKAFMPASQAALGFTKDLETLVGQTFPLKILEFDRSKRRVVVSRRALLEVAKQAAEQKFYATITAGERRTGTVTRLTDFGAFVDLGSGVEGLIHISELSWNRVKSAREIMAEGDQVEVLVTKVDQPSKRISLSLKQIQAHPWYEAIGNFHENGVYPGTVTKLEPFGAFVRLAPGLEGLVHISQISDKKISKPEEVLKVGLEVSTKILKIDPASRKIALSLREVTEDKEKKVVDQFLNAQDEGKFSQNMGDFFKK